MSGQAGTAGPGSVLVLRALGLGDLLVAVPALRALRRWVDRTHPGAALVLACPRAFEPLLGPASVTGPYAGRRPLVDRVLDLDAKEASALSSLPAAWRAVSDDPPLAAVNLHGSGPASHRALAALDPGRLVAFGCPEAGVAGASWEPTRQEHERDRWCRLVREVLGTPADPADLLLDRPAAATDRGGAVVVHPGAAYPSRRWPAERWGRVAEAAAAAGHPVVLTGSAHEVALAEDVRARAGLPLDAVLAGRTDLEELAAVVAAATLVVSGDTGVAHLASAYRTPSVVLFGPTSPARWGPPVGGPHTVLWHGTATSGGDPHAAETDPTLLRVTVEEVVAAVRARLAGGAGREARRAVRKPGGRTTPASA